MLVTTPLPQTIVDAAEAISVPRQQLADSFILHAPLELMGRVGLLPYLDDDTREAAIAQIERLADKYTAAGPAVDAPRSRDFESPAHAASALGRAIAAS